jgi:hypothetical protein
MPSSSSNDPFPEADQQHTPSRDVLLVYMRQLRDGFKDLSLDLKDHREKTSVALENIRLSIAKFPVGCPRAGQCENMWEEVDTLRLEKAEQRGALLGGKLVIGCVSGLVSSLFALVVAYFTFSK